MKKVVVMVTMLALAAPALADDKTHGPDAAPAEPEERSPVWFGAFVTSLAVGVGGIGLYVYGSKRVDDEAAQIEVSAPRPGPITERDCGQPGIIDHNGHFESACAWVDRSRFALLTTAIALPFALMTGYLAFRKLPTRERSRVTLVPTVSTEGAGAMLDLRW